MFCPVCKCEFREGFTRCEGCNADLVHDLASVEAPASASEPAGLQTPVQMADYCGFLDLSEARDARERLSREGIRADILIRESPETEPRGPVQEEYWLRVEASSFRKAAPILGFDHADTDADEP